MGRLRELKDLIFLLADRAWFLLTVVAMLYFLLVIVPNYARADCRWEFVCDSVGHCQQLPICDSSLDVVPPQPPRVTPIVPPSIKPIEVAPIPPIGASECGQVRRCDQRGNCFWDWVCR